MRHHLLAACLVLVLAAVPASGQFSGGGGGGGGLPPVGDEGDCLLVDTGAPVWGACPGAGAGAPEAATYIVQTPDGTLSAEQALSVLGTGLLKNTTTTGVLSIGVAGTDYVEPAGNAATATALAANGANCSAGSAPLGVNTSGAAETCTDYMEEPSGSGIVARTGANTAANRTITGTAGEITVTDGNGVGGNPTISLPSAIDLNAKSLIIPSSSTLPGTCSVGQIYMDTDATTGQRIFACESTDTWALQGDGGEGGGGGGGAPTDATYWTGAGNGSLSAEINLGVLGTGLVINTAGTPSIYAGASCTNQVVRVLSASGAATCVTLTSAFVDTSIWTGTATSGLLKATSQGVLAAAAAGTDYTTPAGNIATATALAANPADCAANNFATTIAANGDLTCAQPSISAGVSGLAAGVATFLGTPSSANLATALTNETGSGAAVFGTAPTLTGASVTTSLNIPNSITLPATCVVGEVYQDTDATTGHQLYACEATDTWVLQGAAVETPTLDQVFNQGKIIDGANSLANAVRIGDGVNSWCIYTDTSTGPQLRLCTDSHVRTTIPPNFTWALYDEEGTAAIETIDPDAASVKAMYTYGTAYKPLKSIWFPAGSLNVDGTQCGQPTERTINSGPILLTIICTDNDASSMYGSVKMPDSWDGGTVTFEHVYLQTAADTGVLKGHIAAQCRGNGEVPSSTWGNEVEIVDAAVVGSNANDMTTSAAVTPAGTCAAGDMLYFRYQLDQVGTTTAVATLHHLGFKMEYSVTSRSD